MNQTITRADMALMPRLFTVGDEPETMFDRIPLTFKLDGRAARGIPAGMVRSWTRERVDANLVRYTFVGHCAVCGLTLRVTHLEYLDFPVSEWKAEFTNDGKADSPVVSEVLLGGEITGDFRAFVHGNGDTCRDDGYEWYTDTLEAGGMQIAPVDATACRGAFPYMKLVFDGFVVRAAVGWPQMWQANVERVEGGVGYTCGQLRCHMAIRPGETMITPTLTLMATVGDECRSGNLWRRWYLGHILPRVDGRPLAPLFCLHYFQCEGKPEFTAATEANQVGALEAYVRRGLCPDVWWLDAGWYKCDYVWRHIGTWAPDAERFPRGLAPIGEACAKHDVRFLLWFEPERVVGGSELHEAHHDWLLTEDKEDGTHADNHLLDLGNPDACDWLIERVDGIIKASGVRIYRQDFNFDPKPIWLQAEADDRIGAIENRHVQGYLRFWDELLYRNPGLLIDACASGGRRNDLETMRRSVPLHYTDVGYGNLPVKQKQFHQMHEWIPYFRAHTMTWDKEKCVDGVVYAPNDEFAYQNAMVPAVTAMMAYDAPDGELETGIAMREVWARAAEIILAGDYYPLSVCRKSYGDWYAVQFDDSDRARGYVQFIRNTEAEDEHYTAAMHVEPGMVYTFVNGVSGERFVKTADELANGLTVALPKRSGCVLFYTMEKQE